MKAEEKLDQEVDRLWQQMRYAYEHGGGHAGHLNNAWHTAMRLSKELRHLHNEVRVLAETLQRCKEVGSFTAECYRLDLERDEALLRQALEALDPPGQLRFGGTGRLKAAAIAALKERLK